MCHKLATYDLDSFWAEINGYFTFITTVQFCEFGKSLTKTKNQVSYDFNISYITSEKKMENVHKRYGSETGTWKYSDVRGVICNLFFLQSKSLPQEM